MRGLTANAAECAVFALAWLATTDDPTVSTNQNSETFLILTN